MTRVCAVPDPSGLENTLLEPPTVEHNKQPQQQHTNSLFHKPLKVDIPTSNFFSRVRIRAGLPDEYISMHLLFPRQKLNSLFVCIESEARKKNV